MNNDGIIFISCGQFSREEKKLGQDVCELIEELTPYKPYFAENQSSLEALTTNILGALDKAVALIAIMHPRGVVKLLGGKEEIRGSVWIEQEIAMAAYITQVLRRPLKVQAYIHSEIRREGMREQLILNPIPFSDETEVLEHLRSVLPNWKGLPSASFVANSGGPVDQDLFDTVSEEISKLDQPHQEAVKLLSQYGSMTGMLVLKKLQERAITGSYEMFRRVQSETGLVNPVSGQPPTKRPEYELRWEINPQFRIAVQKYFGQNKGSSDL